MKAVVPLDWRVALDRLGMMRLLHRFRLGEMRERFPAGWKAFAGFEWYKGRKRAGATFRKLFPFLLSRAGPSWRSPPSHHPCQRPDALLAFAKTLEMVPE